MLVSEEHLCSVGSSNRTCFSLSLRELCVMEWRRARQAPTHSSKIEARNLKNEALKSENTNKKLSKRD